ncbi:hypothetical protein T07_9908 [Trichinella nelsoni]|uniref:Uncharacterized protein n=1 Tax=Trichinella nelsoni TaxID=6336 RepID=A0A0V0RCA3_9BILA|nr:hypothetical protein T07_9908 [Trichinella nelsoni]
MTGILRIFFDASFRLSRTLVLYCALSGIAFTFAAESSVADGDVTILSLEALKVLFRTIFAKEFIGGTEEFPIFPCK